MNATKRETIGRSYHEHGTTLTVHSSQYHGTIKRV